MVRLSYQTMLKTSCIVKITRCTTGVKKTIFLQVIRRLEQVTRGLAKKIEMSKKKSFSHEE